MNLRGLAASDLGRILMDTGAGGAASVLQLRDPDGNAYQATGTVGDTSALVENNEGKIRRRTIEATVRIEALGAAPPDTEPRKGWTAEIAALNGDIYTTYVIKAYPDRTLGVYLLELSDVPVPECKE